MDSVPKVLSFGASGFGLSNGSHRELACFLAGKRRFVILGLFINFSSFILKIPKIKTTN
jgi:hypothetical protein